MERDPEKVKRQLYKCFLAGYKPRYDFESCVDHWCYWFVLSEELFNRIKERALAERDKLRRKHEKRKRLIVAKVAFWSMMKYLAPIWISVTLAFLGFIIIYFIIPVERAQSDISYLQREVVQLRSAVETVQERQNDIEKQNAMWNEKSQNDVGYLKEEITELMQRYKTVQQKQTDMAQEITERKGDNTYLAKENTRLNQEIRRIEQELKDLRKSGEKTSIGY